MLPASPWRQITSELSTGMDSDKRVARFRRDQTLERLLRELNTLLAEPQGAVNRRFGHPGAPVAFIMGAPRSGTTLLFQWMAFSGSWGYPTNLISRFFGAPYLGARVQQVLIECDATGEISGLAEVREPFDSTLGKTRGALAPNEFWYFWRRFFPMGEISKLSADELEKVDRARLLQELASLEAALGKPVVMKAMMLNWNIPFLDSTFPHVLFVHVRRDPLFTMQSLLEARVRFFGTEDGWYSFKPPEFDRLARGDAVTQVAGQVHFTRTAVEEGLARVDPARKVMVDYERLCSDPRGVWQEIVTAYEKQGFYDLPREYQGPARFELVDSVRVSRERWNEITSAWERVSQRDHQPRS